MSTVRQIGINVLTQWGAFVIRAGIGILLVPFLISSLGREYFGIAMLMGVIVSFAEIADLGLRTALGRHLSEALAKGDSIYFSKLASTAAAFWIGVASVGSSVLILFAEAITHALVIPEALRAETVLLVQTFAVGSLLLSFIRPVFTAVISSHNRFDLLSRVEVLSTVLNGAGLYLVLGPGGHGLFGWATVTLSVSFAVMLVTAWIAFRLKPDYRVSPLLVSRAAFKDLFALGSQLFFLQLTNLFSMKADPFILTRFLGPDSLALYRPGLMLSSQIRPLVMVLANQLYPVTTRYQATGNAESLRTVLFLGTRVTFGLSIGAFLVLGVFSQDICRIWLEGALGEDYRIAGYILLGWALVDLFQGAAGSQWAVLIAKSKIKFAVWVNFPLAIINVCASIYLVGFTSLGIVGVIIPTVLIGAFRRILMSWYVAQVCEVGCIRYFQEAYLRPVLMFLIVLPVSLWVANVFVLSSFGSLFLALLVVGGLWGLTFLFIGIRRDERNMILRKIFPTKIAQLGHFS